MFALSSNSQFHPMYRRSLPYMGPPRGWHGHAGPPHGPPYYNHHLHAYDAYWVSLSCVWAAAPYPCVPVPCRSAALWSGVVRWYDVVGRPVDQSVYVCTVGGMLVTYNLNTFGIKYTIIAIICHSGFVILIAVIHLL